jgi:cytochrome c-type biogenesis protein CcmH/NrfG
MDNRLKDAEEAMFQAIKLEPLNPDHYANLGHIYLRAGTKKRAHVQFEEALRIDPDNAKAKKGLKQTEA